MSLLVLTPRYVPLYSGGALQEHRALRAIASHGVPVQVLTLAWPGLPARETIDAVAVRRIGSPSRPGRLRFALACVAAVVRGPQRHRVVVAMAESTFLIASKRHLNRLGCPTVLRLSLEGADDPEAIRSQRFGAFKLRLVSAAREIICLTPALAESCRRSGVPEERIRLLPNAVDLGVHRSPSVAARAAARRRLSIPPRFRVAVFLGALTERKGILDLLDAWGAAGREAAESLLLLCGPASIEENPSVDPAYLERVRQRIDRDDLRGRVRIAGLLDQPGVLDHLRASDIYVSMSRAEGLPNAVLEAMAMGVPVLVTARRGSLDGVLSHGEQGWLVEPGSPSRYLQLLNSAIADPDRLRAMGAAARRRIEDRFSLDAKIEAYRELLARLGAFRNAVSAATTGQE